MNTTQRFLGIRRLSIVLVGLGVSSGYLWADTAQVN